MIHCDEECLNALIKIVDWNLIYKTLGLSSTYIVGREKHLDDVV